MEKKLTAQGPRDRKSYTVTLPIEWIKKENLDKDKIVDLEVIGNKIIISSKNIDQKQIALDADFYANSLVKVLQAVYRTGTSEAKIMFSDPNIIEKILEIVDERLIGYEIMEQKADYIIIKDITRESNQDFKIVLRRIFLLLLQMAESETFIQVKSIDKNMKKLLNYCQRTLINQGHREFKKIPLYYLLLDRIEKIGDELRWVQYKQLNDNVIVDDFDQIKQLIRSAYEIFYKYDASEFDKSALKAYLLKNKIRKQEMSNALNHIYNLSRQLNSLYGDILAIKLE